MLIYWSMFKHTTLAASHNQSSSYNSSSTTTSNINYKKLPSSPPTPVRSPVPSPPIRKHALLEPIRRWNSFHHGRERRSAVVVAGTAGAALGAAGIPRVAALRSEFTEPTSPTSPVPIPTPSLALAGRSASCPRATTPPPTFHHPCRSPPAATAFPRRRFSVW
jgi:hypothetical protein